MENPNNDMAKDILNHLVELAFRYFRRAAADSIDEGDISLASLKFMLTTQIEQVMSLLDKSLGMHLKGAFDNLTLALINWDGGDLANAQKYFAHVEQYAISAFHVARTFDEKISATKLRMLCTFHINGYFTRNRETYNEMITVNILRSCFVQLLGEKEVQSALRDATEGMGILRSTLDKLGGSKQGALRADILSKVFELHTQLLQTTGTVFDVALVHTPSNLPPILVHSGFYLSRIHKVYAHEDTLLAVDTFNNLFVWTASRMKCLTSKKIQGLVDNICIAKSKLFISTLGASARLDVWDSVTYTFTRTITEGKIKFLAQAKDKLFGTVGKSMIVRVWDVNTFEMIRTITSTVYIAKIFAHGDRLYIGSNYGEVLVYGASDGQFVSSISCTVDKVKMYYCITDICAYGTKLYIRTGCLLYVHDIDTMAQITVLNKDKELTIGCLVADEKRLFVSCASGGSGIKCVYVWNLQTMTLASPIHVAHSDKIVGLILRGNRLYSASREIMVTLLCMDQSALN